MNRRTILSICTMTALGLALLPGSAAAQQKSLKEQLVGTWTVVSSESTAPNGAKQQFYGATPKGILILDSGGRYALVTARPDRPKFKSASRFSLEATPEELKAALIGTVANFGTWAVNEADKTFSRRQEGSLIPNAEGAET